MRWALTALFLLGTTMTLRADTFVYASLAPEQKLQVYRLDPQDGSLTVVERLAVDGTPGPVCLDPQKKFLFASLRSTFKLSSFHVDPATGKLKAINTVELPK